MTTTKRKSRITLLRDFLLICLVIPALFVLSFGSALLQEKDTFWVLLAAARLQLTGADIGTVGSSNQRWLIRSANSDAPLENYLKKLGWTHTYKKGKASVYVRGNRCIYVHSTLFTRNYIICQADRHP